MNPSNTPIILIEKAKRSVELIQTLTKVWLASVRASHDFLTEKDITQLTPFVEEALYNIDTLYIAGNKANPVGFIGIQKRKIEMLFLAPDYFGCGLGKQLVNWAFRQQDVLFVDVNEQNKKATGFYEHMGFRTFKRNAYDGQGNPFPILEMRKEQPAILLQTSRLLLREMTYSDWKALSKMLQDETVMYAYNGAFTDQEVTEWLERQRNRYLQYGFGMWAVILRETNEMIGQCGLTMQAWKDNEVLEVGYLFQHSHWHQGYATEAAKECMDYAFNTLNASEICSIIRDTNLPSQRVALRNGLKPADTWTKHYKGVDMPHIRYIKKKTDKESDTTLDYSI